MMKYLLALDMINSYLFIYFYFLSRYNVNWKKPVLPYVGFTFRALKELTYPGFLNKDSISISSYKYTHDVLQSKKQCTEYRQLFSQYILINKTATES